MEHAIDLKFEGNALLRLLMNRCTDEEKRFLTSWIGESKQNRESFIYLRAKVMLAK